MTFDGCIIGVLLPVTVEEPLHLTFKAKPKPNESYWDVEESEDVSFFDKDGNEYKVDVTRPYYFHENEKVFLSWLDKDSYCPIDQVYDPRTEKRVTMYNSLLNGCRLTELTNRIKELRKEIEEINKTIHEESLYSLSIYKRSSGTERP